MGLDLLRAVLDLLSGVDLLMIFLCIIISFLSVRINTAGGDSTENAQIAPNHLSFFFVALLRGGRGRVRCVGLLELIWVALRTRLAQTALRTLYNERRDARGAARRMARPRGAERGAARSLSIRIA